MAQGQAGVVRYIPPGGLTGYALVKLSNEDYAVGWEEITAGAAPVWGTITGALSDQVDLQAALDAKENTGVAAGLIATHEAAGDPHPQYLTQAEGDARYGAIANIYTDEKVDDRVALLIQNGTGITWTYNDAAGTLTPSVSITQYTDEMAQDAVGAVLTDSGTIDFTYNDAGNTITAAVITQMSVTSDASGVKLSGDAAAPGNSKYYGTDGTGTKGFFALPAGAADGLGPDGDKGDITVGGTGTTLTIDSKAVTYAKIQDVTATARILGRKTAAAGVVEECTISEILDFITGAANGDLLLRSGGTWGRLAKGSAAQMLVMDSTAAAPQYASVLSLYRDVSHVAGSHTAARAAGTYWFGMGDPLGVTGTGTLYPPAIIHIAAADYPTFAGTAPKLRLRVTLAVNDVAPTGNFTFGLYPVTRPATSGGAGLAIYTMGTVVSGSNGAAINTPAADSHNVAVSADFALPADGFYVIGVVTTATVAASSHLHLSARLQIRNA